jgi:hypothetical protein
MSPRVRVLAIASLALLLASALALPEPSVYAGADWLRLHLLYKAYAKDALSAGHLPLWNPWVALGRPFLADTETAVLYPPNLLYLVLPIWAALFVLIVGHLALAVTGMLELERLLGFPPWLAWLQAIVFGLGPLWSCASARARSPTHRRCATSRSLWPPPCVSRTHPPAVGWRRSPAFSPFSCCAAIPRWPG